MNVWMIGDLWGIGWMYMSMSMMDLMMPMG